MRSQRPAPAAKKVPMSQTPAVGILDRADCLILLRTTSLGRVVFTDKALPACQPVTFFVDSDRAIFRTLDGSRLSANTRGGAVVGLEADNGRVHEDGRWWTVLAVGRCQPITDPAEMAALSGRHPLIADTSSRGEHVVALTLEVVRGWAPTENGVGRTRT
jgi:uncharacterized protein